MTAFEVERVGGELKRFGVAGEDVHFKVVAPYEPSGDQPQAIDALAQGVQSGYLAGGYATSGYASAGVRRQNGGISGAGAGVGSGVYSGGGYSRDYSQNPVQGGYGR